MRDASKLVLEDCTFKYVGLPIMVRLVGNSLTRVRSHYERLISLTELKHFEEELARKVREPPQAVSVASSTTGTEKFEEDAVPPPPLNTYPDVKRRRLTQKTSSAQVLGTTEDVSISRINVMKQHYTLRLKPESEHPSAKLYKALLDLIPHIRTHPTVPADPHYRNKPMLQVFNDKLAPRLPTKHCAFMECTWAGDGESARLTHLKESHIDLLESAARYLPQCFPKDIQYLSIYNESIAEKIREGTPLASYAIDRRALHNFDDALQEEDICAPMCFLCGCIYMFRKDRTKDNNPTEIGFRKYIQWEKPCESNDRFFLPHSYTDRGPVWAEYISAQV